MAGWTFGRLVCMIGFGSEVVVRPHVDVRHAQDVIGVGWENLEEMDLALISIIKTQLNNGYHSLYLGLKLTIF